MSGPYDELSVFSGNANPAQAALRNWVINLHKELDGTGAHQVDRGDDHGRSITLASSQRSFPDRRRWLAEFLRIRRTPLCF